eukprot:755924-Hanusia_phi.AAC.1
MLGSVHVRQKAAELEIRAGGELRQDMKDLRQGSSPHPLAGSQLDQASLDDGLGQARVQRPALRVSQEHRADNSMPKSLEVEKLLIFFHVLQIRISGGRR